MNRKALFVDRILGQSPRDEREMIRFFPASLWYTIKDALKTSQKYVFTTEAYEEITLGTLRNPEHLVYDAHSAIPPHDPVWFETQTSISKVGPNIARRMGFDPNHHISFDGGHLIHKGTIYSFIGIGQLRDEDNRPLNFQMEGAQMNLVQWVVDLHTPPTEEEQQRFMAKFGWTKGALDISYWQTESQYDKVPDDLKSHLRKHHRARWIGTNKDMHASDWDEFRKHHGMHLTLPMGMLLALNRQKQVLHITPREGERRSSPRGHDTFYAHNIVSTSLGSEIKRYEGTGAGGGWTVGHHPVSGHFFHNRDARQAACTHGHGQAIDWWVKIESADGKERQECLGCGGRRTWRTYPNGKGDPTKRVITHHHLVDY